MIPILYITLNAIAMRIEGGGLAKYLPTTFLARIVPTAAVAFVSYMTMHINCLEAAVLWVLLFIAKIFAINPYSQIAINGDIINITQKRFPPSDWVMAKLDVPFYTIQEAKIWGLVATAIRTSLWALPIIFVAIASNNFSGLFAAIFAPLMAVGYYLGGLVPASDQRILSEYLVGAILGAGLFLAGGVL